MRKKSCFLLFFVSALIFSACDSHKSEASNSAADGFISVYHKHSSYKTGVGAGADH